MDRGSGPKRLGWVLLAAGLLAGISSTARALPPQCVVGGDCDGGGTVTVDELVKGVNLALGNGNVECAAFSCSGAAAVSNNCLRDAIGAALTGLSFAVNGTKRIDVGGYLLRIKCIGSREPTVVLDSGLGDALDVWVAVQPNIAAFTRVCAYDRAGYGSSDPGPLPRDGAQIVSELHALLENSCLPPPYILVGHSLGGLHIHLYAGTYPDEVAGLVFVDGRPAGFYDGLVALDPPLPPDIYSRYVSCDNVRPAAAKAECDSLPTSEDEVAAAASLPHVPMTVFVAGQSDAGLPPDVAAQTGALWLQFQTELAASVPGAKLTIVDECSHYIHLCQPGVITDTVHEQVDAFRREKHFDF